MVKISYGRDDRLPYVRPAKCAFRVTDADKLYLDLNFKRIEVGGIDSGHSADEIKTLPREEIGHKIYFSSDTNELLYYDFNEDKWKTVGSGSGGGTSESSQSAIKDGDGNVITETYKTKAEAATEHNEFAEQIAALERSIANFGNVKYKSISDPSELPANPTDEEKGYIWLVDNGTTSDKYVWVETPSGGEFKNTGSSDVDMDDFYDKSEIDAKFATVNGNIQTVQNSVDTISSSLTMFTSDYAVDKAAFENADKAQKADIAALKSIIGNYPNTEDVKDDITGEVTPGTKNIADRLADLEAKEGYDDTTLSNKVSAIETTLASAVLTDTVYDDTEVKASISAIENSLKDAKLTDTVYDDTSLTNRVKALEDAEAPEVYDDTDLVARVKALEDAETPEAYDDTEVKASITAIEGIIGTYPTTEGTKDIATRLTGLEGAIVSGGYDDTDVKADIKTNADAIAAIQESLEDAVLTDTVYDDTALAARVKALEDAEAPEAYDDTELKASISAIEDSLKDAKLTDTVYDDTDVKADITSIQSIIGTYPTAEGTKDIATRLTGLEGAIVSGGYDDTDVKADIKTNADAISDINDIIGTYPTTEGTKTVTERLADLEAADGSSYDDTALSNKITAIETTLASAVLTDTVYDDTALAGRVSSIEESLEDAKLTDTVYDDTALAARVKALEDAEAPEAYDDTQIKADIKEVSDDLDVIDNIIGDYPTAEGTKSVAERLEALESVETEDHGVLSAALTVTDKIGGIKAGQTFAKGTSVEDILRMLLSPNSVTYPVIVEPSATLTSSITRLNYGAADDIGTATFTATFDRGSISTGTYRSGEATSIKIKVSGSEDEYNSGDTINLDTYLPKNATEEASVTISAVVAYAAGEQPKDSDGENYGTALEAGTVTSNTFTFTRAAADPEEEEPFSTTIYTNHIKLTEEEKQAYTDDGEDWDDWDYKTSPDQWFPEDVELDTYVVINLPNGDEDEYPTWGKVAFPVKALATHVWNPFYQVWDETEEEFIPSEEETTINGQTYYVYTDSRGYGSAARETRFTLDWPQSTGD